jgi:hypothetical protein
MNEASAVLPIWMIISAGFGFFAGEACGDHFRHQKCLEQTNADLHEQLQKARTGEEPLCREMKRLRGEINDIHKHVLAVSKGFEKRPS